MHQFKVQTVHAKLCSYSLADTGSDHKLKPTKLKQKRTHKQTDKGINSDRLKHKKSGKGINSDRLKHKKSGKGINSDRLKRKKSGKGINSDRLKHKKSGKGINSDRLKRKKSGKGINSDRLKHKKSGKGINSDRLKRKKIHNKRQMLHKTRKEEHTIADIEVSKSARQFNRRYTEEIYSTLSKSWLLPQLTTKRPKQIWMLNDIKCIHQKARLHIA